MNENAQLQMIKDSVLFVLSSGFSFHFYLKKNRLEVYCSVFLFFSRCIDHFICYSRIVYIGDSLGHVTNHMLVVDLYQRDCVNLNQSTDLEPRREAIVLSQVGADFPIDELCISKSLLLNLPGKEERP